MAGGIAEMRFGVPENIKKQASNFWDNNVTDIITKFYQNIQAR